MTIKTNCEHCDKPFTAERSTRKYCSSSCRMKAARANRESGDKRTKRRLRSAQALLADVEMLLDTGDRNMRSGDEDDLYQRIRVFLHGRKAAAADHSND